MSVSYVERETANHETLAFYDKAEDRFDRIVSVGMFEHVGVHHYGEFFGKINELMEERMYPLTVRGLEEGMRELS